MMSSGVSTYPSTKERINYARICRAIVDLCTDVLREVLSNQVAPSQLKNKIRRCADLSFKPLNTDERRKINISVDNSSYSSFDITLLYKLIRAFGTQDLRDELSNCVPPSEIWTKYKMHPTLSSTLTKEQKASIKYASKLGNYSVCDCWLLSQLVQNFCQGYIRQNIIPSRNKWGGNFFPNPSNINYGDDIERIRFIRNQVYGHVFDSDTPVTDGVFHELWAELNGIMSRMDQRMKTGGRYTKDLSDIETVSMDDKSEEFISEMKKVAGTNKDIRAKIEIYEKELKEAPKGSTYPSTNERTNYARLCRAIVDLCTGVLRDVLTTQIEPSQLPDKIASCDHFILKPLTNVEHYKIRSAVSISSYRDFNITFLYKLISTLSIQGIIDELRKLVPPNQIFTMIQRNPSFSTLTEEQMTKIKYASSTKNYSMCDSRLLLQLLDHLCPGYSPNVFPSTNKWGGNSLPDPLNIEYGDDIERIRFLRNRVCGHAPNSCIAEKEFETLWTELNGIMLRMDQRLKTGGRYTKDLKDIKVIIMDDKLEDLISEIKKLADKDTDIRDEIIEHGVKTSCIINIRKRRSRDKLKRKQIQIKTQDIKVKKTKVSVVGNLKDLTKENIRSSLEVWSSLHLATITGNIFQLYSLLSSEDHLDLNKYYNISPLHFAVLKGFPRIVKLLLYYNFLPDIEAYGVGAYYLQNEIEERTDKSISFKVNTPIRLAVVMNNVDILEMILSCAVKLSEVAFCFKHLSSQSNTTHLLMEYIKCHYLKTKTFTVLSVTGCYECNDPKNRVILVYSDEIEKSFTEDIGPLRIKYKNPRMVDNEATLVACSRVSNDNPLKGEQMILMTTAVNTHRQKLFDKHSNLNLITASNIKSRKKGKLLEQKPCIVLYCFSKGLVPLEETPFPKSLVIGTHSVCVDVREGFFQFTPGGTAMYQYNTPLRSGGSISQKDHNLRGTLGPFVRLRDGSTGFITCSHIFRPLPSGQIMHVLQPAESDTLDADIKHEDRFCGEVIDNILKPDLPISIDAATVRITKRHPIRGLFALRDEEQLRFAGFDGSPVYDSGNIKIDVTEKDESRRVLKFGSTTGLTRGVLSFNGSAVRTNEVIQLDYPNNTTMTMKGQIEITNVGPSVFFQPGDSGAGVFMVDENKELICIGIGIGCTSYMAAIVTPIVPVLKALRLSHQNSLMKFKAEAMEY